MATPTQLTKRVGAAPVIDVVKRVAQTGGSGSSRSDVWGSTWGGVWGAVWGAGAGSVTGAHPTVDVTKRVTGVITETSTKRVPSVPSPNFV